MIIIIDTQYHSTSFTSLMKCIGLTIYVTNMIRIVITGTGKYKYRYRHLSLDLFRILTSDSDPWFLFDLGPWCTGRSTGLTTGSTTFTWPTKYGTWKNGGWNSERREYSRSNRRRPESTSKHVCIPDSNKDMYIPSFQ